MSLPMDLDEYPEFQLIEELRRRVLLRDDGLCDYCGRDITTDSCKFPDRHGFWLVK